MLAELSQAGATSNLLLHVKSPPRHDPTPIEKQEKQTALHRAGHRQAGLDAIVPLQWNPPSDGVETTESGPLAGCLAVAIVKTQRTGASPRPPLDATSRRHAEDTVRGSLATSASVLHVTDSSKELLSVR